MLFLVSTLRVAFDPAMAEVLMELSGFLTTFAADLIGAAFLTGAFFGAGLASFFTAGLAAFLVAGFLLPGLFAGLVAALFAGLATFFAGLAGFFCVAFLTNFFASFFSAMRGETLICNRSLRQLGARLGLQLEFPNDRLPRNSGLDRSSKDGARGTLILGDQRDISPKRKASRGSKFMDIL